MDERIEARTGEDPSAYYRVRVDIPLRVTPLEDAEVADRTTEVLSQVDEPAPELDSALVGWLSRIERKLDRLLAKQGILEGPHLCLEEHSSVELSAAGMRLPAAFPARPGHALLIEFELPEVPVRMVRCIGRVTRSEPVLGDPPGDCDIAFETIRQSDRDAVVRYTLVVQRQAIRGHLPDRVAS